MSQLNFLLGWSEEETMKLYGIATDQQSFNVFPVDAMKLGRVEEMVSRNTVGLYFVRCVEKWYDWEQNSDYATQVVWELLRRSIVLLSSPMHMQEQQQLARELKFIDVL